MPTYDFICLDCKRRFEKFIAFADYGNIPIACPHCSSLKVQRKIGRVRVAKSDDSRMDDFSDPATMQSMEDDPKAMGSMLRKMKSQVGEDVGPEFDEVVGRLEAGQSPEEIEGQVPGLGNPGPGASPGFDDEDL
jgi:putative FmdB family regulatory protein